MTYLIGKTYTAFFTSLSTDAEFDATGQMYKTVESTFAVLTITKSRRSMKILCHEDVPNAVEALVRIYPCPIHDIEQTEAAWIRSQANWEVTL